MATRCAVTARSASICRGHISAFALVATAAILTTGFVRPLRRDAPTTTSVDQTRSACKPESAFARRHSTLIPSTIIYAKVSYTIIYFFINKKNNK